MYLVTYRPSGSLTSWRVGVADERSVLPVERCDPRFARSKSVRDVLTAGATEVVVRAAEEVPASERLSLDMVELGPPIPDPDKIICLGLNYADHAAEGKAKTPAAPMLFAKFRNSLTGPYADVELPDISTKIDYEGELAVVIGRRCKSVPRAEALTVVGGYTIFDDLSARDIQHQTTQITAGKAIDHFAPMGPGLVIAAEVPDPQQLQLVTRVNGEVRQSASTATMFFPVDVIIAFVSSLMTLEPGDIIATGTPAGVGWRRTPPLYLADGDIVEIEIERLGRICNRMVRSSPVREPQLAGAHGG